MSSVLLRGVTLVGACLWAAQAIVASGSPADGVHAQQALLNAGLNPALQDYARRCAVPLAEARVARSAQSAPQWIVLTHARKHLLVVEGLRSGDWKESLEPGLRKRNASVRDLVGVVVLRSHFGTPTQDTLKREIPVPVYFGEAQAADTSAKAFGNFAVDIAPFKLRVLSARAGVNRTQALTASLGRGRVVMVAAAQPNESVEFVEALHRMARETEASELISLSGMPSIQGGANAVQRAWSVARECVLAVPAAVKVDRQPWRHVELKVLSGSSSDDVVASLRYGRDPVTSGTVNFSRGPHRACFTSPGSDGVARCKMVDPHPHLPGELAAHGDDHDEPITATFSGVVETGFVLTPAVSTR